MSHDLTDILDREDRRNRVLLDYVEALEEGRKPDRSQLLATHPDRRPDLEAFLAGHDQIQRLTAALRTARRGVAYGLVEASREEPDKTPAGLGELGDFRLQREVGRGGMGVVYEAEQISLRRRVALNVLPFAAVIDPRRLQRFKTEALVAAHAQHERIVPVHEVGCERGVHYYAMQFIDGQSLAALIGELRALRDERRDGAAATEAAIGVIAGRRAARAVWATPRASIPCRFDPATLLATASAFPRPPRHAASAGPGSVWLPSSCGRRPSRAPAPGPKGRRDGPV
jgi:hypothetical protein